MEEIPSLLAPRFKLPFHISLDVNVARIDLKSHKGQKVSQYSFDAVLHLNLIFWKVKACFLIFLVTVCFSVLIQKKDNND